MPSEAAQQMITAMRSQAMLDPNMDFVAARAGGNRQMMPLDEDVKVEPVDAGGVPADWISTPNADNTVIIHFHGGGYVIGSAEGHRHFGSRIARAAGARVLMVDYRLAPEHTFPAPVDDAIAAYRYVLGQGVAPENIIISGDSAGGGLAIATIQAVREAGLPIPAAVVAISPWTDLTLSGDSITSRLDRDPMIPGGLLDKMASTYLQGAEPRHPLASPLFSDLSGFPPLLVQVGTEELLYDDSTRIVEKAQAAGVEVAFQPEEGLFHVFPIMPMLPESQDAVERIAAFVRAKTRPTATAGD